jgi:CBS domain-containing protein
MMGGTMRSPFTALVFTLELTHDVNLLPALLIGCIASEAVTVLWLKRSILTEKVARRGHHLTREYTVDPFDVRRIDEIMITNPATLPSTMTVQELADRMAHSDRPLVRRQGAPIVDENGRLVGIITQADLLRALGTEDHAGLTVLEAGSAELIVTHPNELLREAAVKMLRNDIGRLPVVDPADPGRLVGYIDRSRLMAARQHWYEEEHIRERGLTLAKG